MKDRIVIKIGSQVLTRPDGSLDITQMSCIVDQIADLHKKNKEIILVSSGAVASGKSELETISKLDSVSSRQLYSAIGQVKLINRYYDLFRHHGIVCGQILATKEDFSTRRHYLNQRNCMSVMLENRVIPIVNENDAISVNELMFTDNDELSGLVAAMMHCDKLLILSNIDGIFTGDPSHPESRLIQEIDTLKDDMGAYIQPSRSKTGRGGMITKYNIARRVAEEGIEVIIANGKTKNIITDLIQGEKVTSTRFIPSKKETSSVKKWIAHSQGFAKGEVHINSGAKQALLSNKAVSILPVGVTQISGNFEADDIVLIIDDHGKQIGLGRSSYDNVKATELIGLANKKPIVHYDYLYIENNL
ncbi:glutamate 5-kinase [Apibacter sp. HY039]|uniref:glutamate 5-kinase n=1 Tax=Apibacter sp. HY039 TaxID=2501476 RepID=UPI000FEC19F9|nr:glutamate 5-kinase [Apibacter sp. HY039]